MTPAPDWLEGFQKRFGAIVRTPLDRSTGTLRTTPDAYAHVGALDGPRARAPERLGVYNRQYWFRLFTVLHSGFVLTTRLLGHWRFNAVASQFLLERPPRGWNIDGACDGFETWLDDALARGVVVETAEGVPAQALIEAARIDAAWRSVFMAPASTPFQPSPNDANVLLESRLVPSPALAIIREDWPLLALRRTLLTDEGQASVPLPPPLPSPRSSAIVRRAEAMGELELEPREAELYELLAEYPVGEALGRLEARCSDSEKAELPARTQGWLGRSMQLSFWIGMIPPDPNDVTRR